MSIGNILLAITMILIGLTYFGLAVPPVILGIAAIVAGILLLVGR